MTNLPNDNQDTNLTADEKNIRVTVEDTFNSSPDTHIASEPSAPISNAKSSSEDYNDFIYAHYHKKKHSKHRKDHNKTDCESPVISHTSQHYRHKCNNSRSRFREKKWWQKLLLIIAYVFGAIGALILLAILILAFIAILGNHQLTNYSDVELKAPDIEGVNVSLGENGKTVMYNGTEYVFNEDVTSILCIGVDKHELGLEDGQVGTGGQGDALYLIAINTKTGETDVIGVPRDIVTDVGVYSSSGEYIGTEKMQLCLAYAYGDGKGTSCLNTVTAVERLFYQLPINSYFAIDIDSIAELNDAIGGVTVTMTDDSFYDTDYVHHYKGETVTLYGDNARKYIQQRDIHQLESSVNRMDRQINYLKAYTKQALKMTKEDLSTPLNLYNIVENNSATNLTTAKITAFATCLVSNGVSELDFCKVPGTVTSDGTYAQYVVDEVGLYEMILDIYYTPVD